MVSKHASVTLAFVISLGIALSASAQADAGKETLVLSLKYTTYAPFDPGNVKTVSRVNFYGCDVDPNHISDCTFRLEVDGKTVKIPESTAGKLNQIRRSFSYDSLSGTIVNSGSDDNCRVGGDAEGMVLEAVYLKYDASYKIVESKMSPVFSYALNCLFTKDIYSPKNGASREDARAVLEILDTLRATALSKI